MAYGILQSPGVLTRQIDLTKVVPSVPTSQAAMAGVFRWGPINETVVVSSEEDMIFWFLKPTVFNPETWWSAADFLSYSNYLNVARAANYIGNTVTRAFVGNSTNLALTNNSAIIQVGNTQNLSVGMELFYSNSTAIASGLTSQAAPTIAAITNATHVQMSVNATVNTTAVNIVFRDRGSYVAVGQETVDETIDWESQGVLNPSTYPNVDGTFASSVTWVARYLGEPGSSLYVSQCDTANQFSSNVDLIANTTHINTTATGVYATVGSNSVVITIRPADTSNTAQVALANTIAGQVFATIGNNDLIQTGNSIMGYQYLSVRGIGAVTNTAGVYSITLTMNDEYKLGGNTVSTSFQRYWQYFNLFTKAPGTSQYVTSFGNSAAIDEMHIVVSDTYGRFRDQPGAILEKYEGVSRATDAKRVDGGSNYFRTLINQSSKYIWCANPRTTATPNTASFITSSTGTGPLNIQFYGGSNGLDESTVDVGSVSIAYNQFGSPEDYPDVSLIFQGKARGLGVTSNTQLGNFIVDNIAEARGDMMAFVSFDKPLMVNNPGYEAASMKAARLNARYSSYVAYDSGYYYRYDQYNDQYWWVPMNGQVAGLCARTDLTNAPWWSPAGVNRGKLKNVIRLAYNPKQADRDTLYNNDINPVVTMQGAGTMLYGDKTGLGLQSAFSRINVQRLFIVLKKSISRLARQFLFEFNDDFTRAQFIAVVTPYLRDIQGQRGISDFIVVCDRTNNTDEVIMHNEFVASIGVKPAYSINYIYLNFVAVRNDVSFSQVFGPNGSIG
jgi:phage tail sheath protein FI